MKFFARLRSRKKTRGNILFRYGWKITLFILLAGACFAGFSVLRDLGADVRYEERRRNARA